MTERVFEEYEGKRIVKDRFLADCIAFSIFIPAISPLLFMFSLVTVLFELPSPLYLVFPFLSFVFGLGGGDSGLVLALSVIVLQTPLYCSIIYIARRYGKTKAALCCVTVLHIAAVILAFETDKYSFNGERPILINPAFG